MQGYSFRSLTDLVLKIFKTKITAGIGLSGGGSLETDRTLNVNYGTTAGTATQGNDSRVVNAASNATVNAKEAALETKKADKVITIIAGTGLTGGGTLAANRTLNVSYGTTAGTATQGNDGRLSNSREWIAETISQAEAEAGTATTRRAFTAHRVRQAIVAWWNGITGVFGRDLVTSTNNTVARSKLGLGTTATRDTTTSPIDETSSERVMKAGDAGILIPLAGTEEPMSSQLTPGASFIKPSSPQPPDSPTKSGAVKWWNWGHSSWPTQLASDAYSNRMWFRTRKSTEGDFHPWSEFYHTDNLPTTATRWPTFTEVIGRPAHYPTTWNSVDAKPAQATRWPSFAEVTGKPATYTPSSHTHPVSQVIGLGTAATRNVGAASGDVMGVGAFGLGGDAPNSVLGSSIEAHLTRNMMTSQWPSVPPSDSPNARGIKALAIGAIGSWESHLAFDAYSDEMYLRSRRSAGASFLPWVQIHHTGNLLQTTGSSTKFPMSQKATTDAINNSSIGVNQTWQNVTASRDKDTTYTNTTSGPIYVTVNFTGTKTNDGFHMFLDGVDLFGEIDAWVDTFISPISVIVPKGSTYRVTFTNGSVTKWVELR